MAEVSIIDSKNGTKKYEELDLRPCRHCGNIPPIFVDNPGLFVDEHGYYKYRIECCCENVHSKTLNCVVDSWNEAYGKKLDEKPPLGIKPSWLQAEERIKELAWVIGQYSDHLENEENIKHIRAWAEEIQSQCDIIEFIDKV